MIRRDPTARFTGRVEAYVRSRPSYPPAILEVLRRECGLAPDWVIADIGSGTGLLSRLFLEQGYPVFGVEPNRAMREAGERLLADCPLFTSVAGSAEDTKLQPRSVDLVAAGQAFHWFQPQAARSEFERILVPAGWVMLVWNERRKQDGPFLRAYEHLLLRHGVDYRDVDHTRIGAPELGAFFGPAGCYSARFDNHQRFDFEGLRQRLLSSSYAPGEDEPGHRATIDTLRRIFDRHQIDGQVTFDYDTRLYFGRLC